MIETTTFSNFALVEPPPDVWDAFVDGQREGNLLQRHAWAELKGCFGWHARRIALLHAPGIAGSEFSAGAQMLFRKRYGLSVAYTPRGPLFSGDEAHDELLLRAMLRVARRQRAVFVRLEPNLAEGGEASDRLHSFLLRKGFQPVRTIQPRSTLLLDLQRAEPAILAAMSKGHRADIRRAERQGVTVRVGDERDCAAFYAIMLATGARAGFSLHSEAYYRAAWRLHQPRARLLLAELGGETVAAHMVFADKQAGRYLYSGAHEAGLKSGANHLLEWAAIRWARELGCTHYDFWGIPDALGQAAGALDDAERAALEADAQHDPLIGVYRFKKGFGGQVVRYLPAYDAVLLPPLYRLARSRID